MKPIDGGPGEFLARAESLWPEKAEYAIRRALNLLDADPPTPDQLADLADAVDAYTDGKYYAAMVLAGAAAMKRSVARARRPTSFDRTLTELKDAFRQLQIDRRESSGDEEA